MSNKRAKALRKLLKYHPRDKDAFNQDDVYMDHPVDTHYKIPIIDIREGKPTVIGYKDGTIPGSIIECVYGPYKEYKMLKKLDKNPNYHAELIMLPTKEETNKIAEELRSNQGETDGKLNTEN